MLVDNSFREVNGATDVQRAKLATISEKLQELELASAKALDFRSTLLILL